MSDDFNPMKLYGPLCKIFDGATAKETEESVNAWIKAHPNAYLEQQETDVTDYGIIVTIWYTEDTAE